MIFLTGGNLCPQLCLLQETNALAHIQMVRLIENYTAIKEMIKTIVQFTHVQLGVNLGLIVLKLISNVVIDQKLGWLLLLFATSDCFKSKKHKKKSCAFFL
jgi:hypothetical protein